MQNSHTQYELTGKPVEIQDISPNFFQKKNFLRGGLVWVKYPFVMQNSHQCINFGKK